MERRESDVLSFCSPRGVVARVSLGVGSQIVSFCSQGPRRNTYAHLRQTLGGNAVSSYGIGKIAKPGSRGPAPKTCRRATRCVPRGAAASSGRRGSSGEFRTLREKFLASAPGRDFARSNRGSGERRRGADERRRYGSVTAQSSQYPVWSVRLAAAVVARARARTPQGQTHAGVERVDASLLCEGECSCCCRDTWRCAQCLARWLSPGVSSV